MRPKRSSSPSPAYLGSSYRFRQALARPPARSRFWLGAPTTRLRKARSCRREGGRPGRKRRFPRAASRENGGGALWSRIAISAVLVARTLGDLVGCPLTAPISGWTRPSITRGRPPRARGRRPLRARDGRRRGPGGRCRGRPGGPAARQLPSGRQASAERSTGGSRADDSQQPSERQAPAERTTGTGRANDRHRPSERKAPAERTTRSSQADDSQQPSGRQAAAERTTRSSRANDSQQPSERLAAAERTTRSSRANDSQQPSERLAAAERTTGVSRADV